MIATNRQTNATAAIEETATGAQRGRRSTSASMRCSTRDRKPDGASPSVSVRATSSICLAHIEESTLLQPVLNRATCFGDSPLDRACPDPEHRPNLLVGVVARLREE